MQINLPKISVIVPTFNRGYIITKCLESICAQSFKDLEIIVVDDGSTDDTEAIVKNFNDPRIHYIKHPQNKGLAAALNTGCQAAKTEFIAELSTDDLWIYADKLKKEYMLLNNSGPEIGAVYSDTMKEVISGEKSVVPPPELENKEGYLYEEFLKTNITCFQAALIKKSAWLAVGGVDKELLRVQDWDFLINLSKQFKFLHLPKLTTEVKISPDSNTKNQKLRLLCRTKIFEKHREAFLKRRQIAATHAYSIGHAWALLGEMQIARSYLWLAVIKKLNSKNTAAFILSLLNSPAIYKKAAEVYTRNPHRSFFRFL